MNIRQLKHEELYISFLRYIDANSMARACQAGDDKLTAALQCDRRTITNLLNEGEKRGDILVDSKTVVVPDRGEGRFRTLRTIYLVSRATDEQGALMVATLLCNDGPKLADTKATRWELCGKLRCTQDQLERWLKLVMDAGWYRYEWLGDDYGCFAWTKVKGAKFGRVGIPGRDFLHGERFGRLAPARPDFTYVPPANSEQRFIDFLNREGGSTARPLREIAAALGFGADKTRVSKLAASAERKGLLTRVKDGRNVRYSLVTELTAAAAQVVEAPAPVEAVVEAQVLTQAHEDDVRFVALRVFELLYASFAYVTGTEHMNPIHNPQPTGYANHFASRLTAEDMAGALLEAQSAGIRGEMSRIEDAAHRLLFTKLLVGHELVAQHVRATIEREEAAVAQVVACRQAVANG